MHFDRTGIPQHIYLIGYCIASYDRVIDNDYPLSADNGRNGIELYLNSLFALFLGPLFASIPGAATAPALILVGAMMISPVREIDFNDLTEGIPAFLCVLFMICAYSISDGIMFGIMSYVLINLLAGKSRKINHMAWVICAMFLLRIVVGTVIK